MSSPTPPVDASSRSGGDSDAVPPAQRRLVAARRAVVLLLLTAGLSLGGVAAWAYWGASVTAGAAGAGLAASVNAATTPTALRTSATSVALSWSAVTLSNGVAVDGYVVKRYDAGTLVTQTVLGGCAGTVGATTCTETNVPTGNWRYAVYPRIGTNWTGIESGMSPAVAVTTPVLTLVKTVYNAAASTTGTLSGFGVNESVTYRLDSATVLTGHPSVVDTTGAAPISSLAIPATTEGTHTVYAIGANGSIASTTITYDSVAPTTNAVLSPAAGGSGWNTTSPVQVTLSAADTTSSIASIRYTLDGSDPTSSGTALTYSSPFTVAATTTVRYYATDAAGNSSAVATRLVRIDAVAPGSSLALGSATNARLSGSTVYFRGSAGGSFTLINTVTDAGSGPASSATAALTGSTTGWSHTPSSVTTPSGGPYTSNSFTWTNTATGIAGESVTSADVAGNTTVTALSFVNDSTGPTGGSAAVAGGATWSTSTTLAVTSARGTDAGVGLAASGALLQRATATLSGGACGTFGSFTTVATDPAASINDPVADQACYRYQFVVADLLGNTTTYTSTDVKVDTTAPTTPTLSYSALTNAYATGSTVYYRGATSGSFTVTAASTDAASGIASYSFPSLGTGWTSTPGALGINTYSWTASPAAPGARQVAATNGAGLSTNSASFTPTDDSMPPTGGSLTYNAGYTSSNSVTLTFAAGSDAASGLNAAAHVLQRRSAPLQLGVCSATWSAWATLLTAPTSPRNDTTVTGDNCYQYQYIAYDNVGNSTAYPANSNPIVKVPMYYTCQEAAIGGSALAYYRLAEASGATAADSSGNGKTGQYAGVSSYNAGGPCGGGGVTFNGVAMGYVSTPLAATNPTLYSQEVWFKTSSGNSMRLMGFGDQQTGSSSSYDRLIYLDTSSKLVYGYNAGFLSYKTLTTTATYNDSKWHQVVATQSPTNGMRLYVDGALMLSDATATTPQSYAGYWRVGSDNMSGWPALTILINSYMNGSLAHASFYARELATQEVFNHYLAAQLSSGGVLTAPTSIAASAQSAGSTIRRPGATASASSTPSAVTPSSPSSAPSMSSSPSSSEPTGSTSAGAPSPPTSSATSPSPWNSPTLTGIPSFAESEPASPDPLRRPPTAPPVVLPACPSGPRSCSAEATPSG